MIASVENIREPIELPESDIFRRIAEYGLQPPTRNNLFKTDEKSIENCGDASVQSVGDHDTTFGSICREEIEKLSVVNGVAAAEFSAAIDNEALPLN